MEDFNIKIFHNNNHFQKCSDQFAEPCLNNVSQFLITKALGNGFR